MEPTFVVDPCVQGRIGLCSARVLEVMVGSPLPFTTASMVVLLLTEEERRSYPGLHELGPLLDPHGVVIVDHPVLPFGVPSSLAEVMQICSRMIEVLRRSGNVLVCDSGGAGRSGTLAACCMVALGRPAHRAIAQVRRACPEAIETKEQEAFIRFFRNAIATHPRA